MFNTIKKAIELSKKDLNIEGRMFYYSAQTTIIAASVLIALIIVLVTSIVNYQDYFLLALTIVVSILPLKWLYNTLHKFIYIGYGLPLFIIKDNQLYYTKTGTWFDLENSNIFKTAVFRSNFSGTLVIEENQTLNKLEENFWFIEYDDELKELLCRIKKTDSLFDWRNDKREYRWWGK